jgi:hypothetical protein
MSGTFELNKHQRCNWCGQDVRNAAQLAEAVALIRDLQAIIPDRYTHHAEIVADFLAKVEKSEPTSLANIYATD